METSKRILIIEDELSMRQLLQYIFSKDQYEIVTASSGAEGRAALQENDFDAIIQDMMLPDVQGTELLEFIRKNYPKIAIVVITAETKWQTAVDAMRLGAFNYIKKPFDNRNIRSVVSRAIHSTQYKKEKCTSDLNSKNLIGNSDKMQKIQEMIYRVSPTDATILITGDNGAGKELVARAIHEGSSRQNHGLIAVNCGAIAESIMESELFGHVPGAFTGAIANKKGLFSLADHGTLFLDEIGEMSLQTQVKLLRVLEDKSFTPVGSEENVQSDVRIIAATNRCLADEVEKGNFREDLYYRLNVIPIHIAPLRERREDVPLLAGHFLSVYASRFRKKVRGFSNDVMDIFMAYEWPGNIRQLSNLIQRCVLMSEEDLITTKDLGDTVLKPSEMQLDIPKDFSTHGMDLEAKLIEIEKFYICKALKATDYNLTKAAKLLNVTFRSLRYKVKKYKIEKGSDSSELHQDSN